MYFICIENVSYLGIYNIFGFVVDVYRVVILGGVIVRFSVMYEFCYLGIESLFIFGLGE